MAEIDDWADCLPSDLRSVWPRLAEAVAGTGGALFGGTALAVHLRHRQSFDLDYLTPGPFDTDQVSARLAAGGPIRVLRNEQREALHAVVDGVLVEVFKVPERGYNPGHVRSLAHVTPVDGLAVASLPDLLASKLDVLLYRSKLRDYIDLAAIDQQSQYSLEDGLLFHIGRYGATPNAVDQARVIGLLEDPGEMATDRVFDKQRAEALDHLKTRAPAMREFLYHEILDMADPPAGAARDLPETPALADRYKEALHDNDSPDPGDPGFGGM